MKTLYLIILILASASWNARGDANRPVSIQTNVTSVVRSPFSSAVNRATRRVPGNTALRSTQLNASNHLATTAVSARSVSQSDIQRMELSSNSARAGFGLHKVGFAGSLGGAQPVSITTPDNHRLSFRPIMLAYYDTASGQTVPLAEVRDCGGGVQWPDRVIYTSAFSDLNADVQYVCTPNSLEQNIILRQCPPAPENLGLNPETTRLEIWTEWFDTAPVRTQQSVVTLRAGTNGANAVTASDTALDFGTMKIVRGRAFNLDGAPDAVPVAKEWAEVQGRKFLLEAVDYKAIQQNLQTLTAAATPSVKKTYASREQMSQSLAANVIKLDKGHTMQLADAEAGQAKGVVLDFTIIDSIPLPQGAIAWWPAGGDANDVVGSHDGALQGGSSFGAGEVGQGFVLDGSSGYVSVSDDDAWAFGTNDFTIELWANFANYPSSWEGGPDGGIFVSSDEGPYDVNKWWFATSGGVLHFHINDPANGPIFLVNADFNPDLGTWYHFAMTRSGDTYTIYVNGEAVGTDTCSRTVPNADIPLMIGQAEGFYFNGSLDEVTIYDRALSDSEIAAIYYAGGAGKDNPQCVAPSSNAIGWWAGDGTADDLVNTNNGTLQGGAACSSGEVGQAFDLDGNSGYVSVPDNDLWAFGNNDFTIELWANFADNPWGDEGHPYGGAFISSDEGPYDVNKWWFTTGGGVIDFHINDPVNGPIFLVNADFWPDPGAWYHLALTRSGDTYTVYVNGVAAGSDTCDRAIPNADVPLMIGQAEGFYFNGQLDEVTIYNRALSDSEIAAIYSAGGAGKCKGDLDFDGLPDWWEWYWFGSYSLSGTNRDANGYTLFYDYQHGYDPNIIQFTVNLGNQNFNVTNATGSYLVLNGIPYHEAVLVNDTNLNDAVWTNYDGIVHVSLGPTDGVYQVWFGLKGFATNAQPSWFGTDVTLNRSKPQIFITNPTTNVVATPYIQLQGYSAMPLASVMFDVSNAVSFVTNQPGSITGHFINTNTLSYTTDYFQCYDLPLTTNGPNVIVLHATDLAGNTTNIALSVTLDYSTATAPVIKLTWPTNGIEICGSSFTLRGWTEDASAKVTAQITDSNLNTNVVSGIVERTGVLWAKNLPLAEGQNVVTLCVTNSAGLSSTTNITVVKSDMTLTLDSVDGDLWLLTTHVSGSISDTTAAVWVNGVQGTNYGNGSWEAYNVPVTPGGVASFDVNAIPAGGGDPGLNFITDKPDELLVSSDIWGYDAASGPVNGYNYYTEHAELNYSYTTGGRFFAEDQYSDQYSDYTDDTVWVLGSGGVIKSKDVYHYSSFGNSHEHTDGPCGTWNFDPGEVEEGVLLGGPDADYPSLISQSEHSEEKLSYLIGGPGVIGQTVLVLASASANPEFACPIWITAGADLPYEQIAISGLGYQDSQGRAHGVAAIGGSVDATPVANNPMYVPFLNFVNKYVSHFEVFVHQPDPTSTNHFKVVGGDWGHAWWEISSDAPVDIVNLFVSTNCTHFLNDPVGYGHNDPLDWKYTAPGTLSDPDKSTSTTNKGFNIGFYEMLDGLTFTEDLSTNLGRFNGIFNNCVKKVIAAGAAVGVTLPNDTTPESFGFDLNASSQ